MGPLISGCLPQLETCLCSVSGKNDDKIDDDNAMGGACKSMQIVDTMALGWLHSDKRT